MDTVDEFLKINGDWLIGVHCTHGLNRTGYMVCRYLRDRVGIPAKDAIKSFEIARGYQIERANFIADLLGKTPIPPDLGKETVVKPVENVYQIKQSVSDK
nr:RNA/RNP complex-1-interacting phosphatase [Vanessa tameamea]